MGRASWVTKLKESDPVKYIQFCEKQRENGLNNREKVSARMKSPWNLKSWEELGKDGKRRRVIEEQNNCCNSCHLSHWMEQPIPLELEHKDGSHMNDERGNLEALCPNCHSLTSTWRGRNKSLQGMISNTELAEALNQTSTIRQALIMVGLSPRGGNYIRAKKLKQILLSGEPVIDTPPVSPERAVKGRKVKELNFCSCGKSIDSRSIQCIDCYVHQQATKIEWPGTEELEQMVAVTNYSVVGRNLGVSANSVKKRLKKLSASQGL